METTLLANPPTLQCSPYQEVNGKIHCLQPLEGLLKFKYIYSFKKYASCDPIWFLQGMNEWMNNYNEKVLK